MKDGPELKKLSIYPLSDFLTPLTLTTFTTEEITGCTIEAGKGANKAPQNLCSCFLFYGLLFK